MGAGYVCRKGKAALGVIPLGRAKLVAKTEPTVVFAGTGPGKGKDAQRGHHLELTTAKEGKQLRLITLLVPMAADGKLPQADVKGTTANAVHLKIRWAEGGSDKFSAVQNADRSVTTVLECKRVKAERLK